MVNEDLEMMRCQQLFALLSEFIDGRLPDGICREIQAHLSDCEPCEAFLRTLQKTVEICQQLPREPLPQETRRELRELLQAELSGWQSR
jgi:RNA polymerase sigma-70 factor (ECF subfamily)